MNSIFHSRSIFFREDFKDEFEIRLRSFFVFQTHFTGRIRRVRLRREEKRAFACWNIKPNEANEKGEKTHPPFFPRTQSINYPLCF